MYVAFGEAKILQWPATALYWISTQYSYTQYNAYNKEIFAQYACLTVNILQWIMYTLWWSESSAVFMWAKAKTNGLNVIVCELLFCVTTFNCLQSFLYHISALHCVSGDQKSVLVSQIILAQIYSDQPNYITVCLTWQAALKSFCKGRDAGSVHHLCLLPSHVTTLSWGVHSEGNLISVKHQAFWYYMTINTLQ